MPKLYKAYLFRDKDPAIDELRTVVQDHFGTRNIRYKQFNQVERSGGPTAGTLDKWFNGDTKRPQNATIEAAGRALGKRRVWVDSKRKS